MNNTVTYWYPYCSRVKWGDTHTDNSSSFSFSFSISHCIHHMTESMQDSSLCMTLFVLIFGSTDIYSWTSGVYEPTPEIHHSLGWRHREIHILFWCTVSDCQCSTLYMTAHHHDFHILCTGNGHESTCLSCQRWCLNQASPVLLMVRFYQDVAQVLE